MFGFLILLKFLLLIALFLVGVAFFTLSERKFLSFFMLRQGPNKVSVMGIFQPFSDAIKLSNKSVSLLASFYPFIYYFSSFMMLLVSLLIVLIMPFKSVVLEVKFNMVLFFILLSMNTLNIIFLGWNSFGKYSLIGAIRTVSLLISYECVIFLVVYMVMSFNRMMNLSMFSNWELEYLSLIQPWLFYFWMVSIMIELNRTPFDFSEGESELVSGYNVDFGSLPFTLMFLAEYTSIVLASLFTTLIFLKGNFMFFCLILMSVLWIRSVLPRYRYDMLMKDCWYFIIPAVTIYFIFLMIFLFF